ncbi:MAG: OB-fold nucleic acid binding domain-containing protein [Halodesulfurarchaeum sp.]
MSSCIICGSEADGDICSTHEEDVFFEFRGEHSRQLVPNRYYRGSVDGFAEFGVFVDIGPVTGLLHRSEIPKRLESLEWEPGDEVFVQVLDIHDNGNIDLGWSLRQTAREFRGKLVQDPELGRPLTAEHAAAETTGEEPGKSEAESEPAPSTEQSVSQEPTAESATKQVDDAEAIEAESSSSTSESQEGQSAASLSTDTALGEGTDEQESATETEDGDTAVSASSPSTSQEHASRTESAGTVGTQVETPDETGQEEHTRTTVSSLPDAVGETVTLEGEITDVRQTSGPTVFEFTDETGSIECAAFEEAGVRAYPSVDVGEVVRLVGEVERRRGSVQVETTSIERLSDAEREAVSRRIEDARTERSRPDNPELLVPDPDVDVVHDELVDAATTMRRAVFEERPIIVRHTATIEGYVAGTALERALLPLIREEHDRDDAEYHYVDRRPLDDDIYDIDAATDDVTDMLEAADRHDEKRPLYVLVDAGSSRESVDGIEFLSIYDASTVVVDGGYADAAAADTADVLVSPTASGGKPVPTGTIGVHLAALVNDEVRDDLRHLPATNYWHDVPDAYLDLAEAAGYDRAALFDIRNAVALEAFYQSYEDKRELIADLFWDDRNRSLSAPISEQFEEKLETEIETARSHLERRDESGVAITVLDVEEYTHQYDFPPTTLLIDELHRRLTDGEDEPTVTIGLKRDELRLQSTTSLDVRAIGDAVANRLPDAGVTTRGGRDGRIEFLAGEREAVLEAGIDEVATWLG